MLIWCVAKILISHQFAFTLVLVAKTNILMAKDIPENGSIAVPNDQQMKAVP